MSKKPLVVHCIYNEDGPDIKEIILESFKVFLKKELRIFGKSMSNELSRHG